jgi:hypothetical protein
MNDMTRGTKHSLANAAALSQQSCSMYRADQPLGILADLTIQPIGKLRRRLFGCGQNRLRTLM